MLAMARASGSQGRRRLSIGGRLNYKRSNCASIGAMGISTAERKKGTHFTPPTNLRLPSKGAQG